MVGRTFQVYVISASFFFWSRWQRPEAATLSDIFIWSGKFYFYQGIKSQGIIKIDVCTYMHTLHELYFNSNLRVAILKTNVFE